MFVHEVKLVATAIWSTMLIGLGLAQVTNDWLTGVPVAGFGVVGMVFLVWKLLRDNKSDAFIRDGYQRMIMEEREARHMAELRCAELEKQVRYLMGEHP